MNFMTGIIQHARDMKELERKVQEHFQKYGWQLEELQLPEKGDSKTILAVPKGIEDELMPGDIGDEWYDGLTKIGQEYGVRLAIPCWVYMK